MTEGLPHITSPGKNQNSKPEVQFLMNSYHLSVIVKSKNCKVNHLLLHFKSVDSLQV